ncbi:MAG: hypothetical protein HY314_06540 [Acidobacteria bacterium]|nr:hypothetical protein [Acidobacteriota bacterium]
MDATLVMLKAKIDHIKREMVEIERLCEELAGQREPSAGEHLQARLEQGRQEKETLRRIANQTLAEMGIHCLPVPAEELQRMMLECGIKPEENLFSRGIIEMREE